MNDAVMNTREVESDMQSIKSLFNNMQFELQSANVQTDQSFSPKANVRDKKEFGKSNF